MALDIAHFFKSKNLAGGVNLLGHSMYGLVFALEVVKLKV
jgi:hypothetical protein